MIAEGIERRAISTYGKAAQIDVAIEEMSELTKALLKERRSKNPAKVEELTDIAEEMADVLIMMEQLGMIFNNGKAVESWKKYKLERLERRLNEVE